MTSSVYFKVVHITQLKEATDDAVSNKGDLTNSTQRSLRTFVSALLCYHSLSFCSYESSLHRVFT
jgi:hypothetical protein